MKQITFICSPFSHALQIRVCPQALWNFRCVLLYRECVLICSLCSPARGIQVSSCMFVNFLQGFFLTGEIWVVFHYKE